MHVRRRFKAGEMEGKKVVGVCIDSIARALFMLNSALEAIDS